MIVATKLFLYLPSLTSTCWPSRRSFLEPLTPPYLRSGSLGSGLNGLGLPLLSNSRSAGTRTLTSSAMMMSSSVALRPATLPRLRIVSSTLVILPFTSAKAVVWARLTLSGFSSFHLSSPVEFLGLSFFCLASSAVTKLSNGCPATKHNASNETESKARLMESPFPFPAEGQELHRYCFFFLASNSDVFFSGFSLNASRQPEQQT